MERDRVLSLFKRIKNTDDGKDFIDYLNILSLDNYKAFKNNDNSMNELHKGYALAIDNLIDLFKACDVNHMPSENVNPSQHY